MSINGTEHYKNIIDLCKHFIDGNYNFNGIEDVLCIDNFLCEFYSNDFIKQEYKAHLIKTIQPYKYGCVYNNIIQKTPQILMNDDFISASIHFLISSKKIKLIDKDVYILELDSFADGLKCILKDKEYDVFIKRSQNLTLEEIGSETGITRERIRQIESKAIDRMNKSGIEFQEDVYANIFIEYEFTPEDFVIAFKNIQTYYYLSARYNRTKGGSKVCKKALSEALTDNNIPEKMKRLIEKAVYKNYIKLGIEYVLCNRPNITNYVLKTFANNDIRFEDFTELYLSIIEDIGKKDDEKLSLMDRGYENRLAASDTVLWKYGKKLRYYNMNSYDFDKLFEILNLEQYRDVEYSTQKFFKMYPETMKEYDIRDEYELHNLLKKLCKNRSIKNINFARMPIIEFGHINRDEQVLNLLLTLAPVSNTDFAAAYEEEYGVGSATVLANYMKEFDDYFHDGMYKIDAPMLPQEVSLKLKELLIEDFYLFERIKQICFSAFPTMDKSLLNPFSIKSLGFKVYSSYVISDKFNSATDYFNNLLLQSDILDLDNISPDIKQLLQFTSQLYKLKAEYAIVEFSPNKYIKYERLHKNGITKDIINTFNDNLFNFVGQGKYFTIQSILNGGFSNTLDDFGFENWFYSSLVAECKDEVSYLRIGGNKLFILGKVKVALEDFIENIIFAQSSLSMDVYDLKDMLQSYYGINTSTYKLIEASKNTSMYYDVVSEKIYADYDTYYEEV